MILTCPECATRYFVGDDQVGPQGRTVKCASCGARWTARAEVPLELTSTPEEGAVAAFAPDPEPAEEVPVSELPGEELPKVFRARAADERRVREAATIGIVWAGMAAAVAVMIAGAVVFRMDVVRIWPRTAGAYANVGLPVNRVGLTIEGVRAEPSLQDGHAALSVSGVIRNIEDYAVTAPPLRISLLNPAGKRVGGKIAAAADPKIPPGETRHFAIAILDPPTTAQTLEIGFVLDAGADKAVREAAKPVKASAAKKLDLRGAVEATSVGHAVEDAAPLPHDSPYALQAVSGHD